VTVGEGAVIDADSFLMKGEDVPAGARWAGNPAREMNADRTAMVGGN
jgi:acetyltransferase-like isoleucine patch superfamily enzyme